LREQKKIANTKYKLNILENTMGNVKQLCLNSEDLANSSPSYAVQVLTDCDSYMFEDVMDMDYCAAKAGVELLSFEKHIGRLAHGSCEEEAFREQQAIGMIRRVSFYEDEANLKHEESVKEYLSMMSDIAENSSPGGGATDAITEAVSGSHYNDVVPGWQYMEMMEHMLADKKGVEAHLLGQIYKYLFRTGKKDDVEQEYRKARWYINCLVKFKQTGKVDCEGND